MLPRALLWVRTGAPGAEQVSFDDRRGLIARGVQLATDPVPYACRYELYTDEGWATARFEATAEGGGWLRTVRLERAAGRWRVTTAEQGDLDAALRAAGRAAVPVSSRGRETAGSAPLRPLAAPAVAPLPGIEDADRLANAYDVDLYASPLTNTLPLRRIGMIDFTITAVWVLLPSLAVVPSTQSYTVTSPRSVRYASGDFRADLDLDEDRFVVRYPGLAERGAYRG
jgi:uncharacterized protein